MNTNDQEVKRRCAGQKDNRFNGKHTPSSSDRINNYLNEIRSLNKVGPGQIMATVTAGVAASMFLDPPLL